MEGALRRPGATLPGKIAQLLAGGELAAATALAAASGDVRLATIIPQVCHQIRHRSHMMHVVTSAEPVGNGYSAFSLSC